MKEQIVKIESQALKLGIFANLIMAFSGWGAYYLSGSEALMLDGNISFILFITAIVALKITQIKSLKTENYPFGLYVTEALYSLTKGLLLLGVVISAIVTNGSKILSYLNGDELATLQTGIIVYYAIAMVAICWGLSAFYYFQNKKINNNSSMLIVDQKSSFIDGILSASTGAVLIVIGSIEAGSSYDFLLYIGDAILVFILALLMIRQPLTIISGSFVELAGGKLQNREQHQEILTIVSQYLQPLGYKAEPKISKTGSSYLVVIEFPIEVLQRLEHKQWRQEKLDLTNQLANKYPHIDVEMVVR
ncbi:hypothetical protein BIY22_11815 [Vibrio panuliri]|uniref:Cation efflux protein transmembrane domain-containing protein n=1 Tax=Vibrio panuliri TaxID=1381081 RepID=A0A1Q9HB08_9VIBR|nr:cation transporter [Vibrio panuliri]OLQ86327.1 hypothetical protein BIY22_11815 [Vibrio panuliri]